MLFYRRSSLIASASLFILGLPAGLAAQEAHEEEQDHGPLDHIVVTASPLNKSRFDVLQGNSVLEGDELDRELSGTIGETLDLMPGVSQSSFGPGASRPVIRGLSGDRLRILIGGIGTLDLSTTSADHAVAVDLTTAKEVEVLRGPATLLYGNNAVAGVINVLDGRIPTEVPENGFSVNGRTGFATNADEVNFGGAVDAALTNHFVVHFDGFWRDTDNIRVPGFVRSDRLRASEPLHGGEEEPFRIAENSDVRNKGVTGGASFVGEHGFFGVSVSYLDNNYGIPAELEEEEEEEGEEGHGAVRIDIEQVRFDLMGELNRDFLIFEKAKIRFGYGDYDQAELEGDEIGTLFHNNGWEGRFELVQQESNGLGGAFGVQIRKRDFAAIGAEAFVPPNETFQYGLFGMQQFEDGPWTLEAGMRIERQTVEAASIGFDRAFTGFSTSGGLSYNHDEDILVGLSIYRTERAPNAEELFSDGPHLATFTFELGDPTLGEETALGGELTFKKQAGPLTGALNLFYVNYSDFIFENFTGGEEDGLPIARFTATDAEFYGFELESEWLAYEDGDRKLIFDLVLDYVRATNLDFSMPLPRIPPFSVQVGTEYQTEFYDARIGFEWASDQDRLATLERATDGYFDLSASVAIRPFGDDQDVTVLLQAKNLTNAEIRHHTSFLKDLVPTRGRDFRMSARFGF